MTALAFRLAGTSLLALLSAAPASAQQPTTLPPITVTTPKAEATTLERAPVAKPSPAPAATVTQPSAPKKQAGSPSQTAPQAAPATASAADPATAATDLRPQAVATAENGTSATVITAREIERQQIRSTAEALRALPGVAVSRSGNMGGVTQVRLRGAEGNHTLVLIDGIQANAVTDGEFDFSNLPTEDIERIEVIRGPMSGLYGSGAVGGVIAITTKGGRGPASLTLKGEVGSFGTRDVSVRAGGGNDQAHLAVSAHGRLTSGFNITEPDRSITGEKDGARISSFALKGGVKLAPTISFDVTARHTDKRADRDADDFIVGGAIDDRSRLSARTTMLGAALKADTLGGALTHELRLDHSNTAIGDQDELFGKFHNEGKRLTATYAATARLGLPAIYGRHVVTGLIQTETEEFTPLSDFVDPVTRTRKRLGVAGEWRATFADQLDVTGALRRDDLDVFEAATTGRVSMAWRIPGTALRPHASYGTAVKLPSMFEMFGAYPAFFLANPHLKPEHSRGFDAGLEVTLLGGKAVVDVTYFSSVLTDKIALRGFPSTPVNLAGESTRAGVEVASRLQLMPGLSLGLAYTYTDAQDPDGARETRRPPHSGRIDLASTFAQGKGTWNIAAAYNGTNYDNVFALGRIVPLSPYWLVTAAASYKLQPNVEVYGRLENALDAKYQEIYGYNTPGIAAYVGMKVTLGPGAEGAAKR